ncbi:integrase core domain-containing protein [Delftia sp. NA_296.1]|uniref:integrase core domain-containing protein n=1 Tax=Delftia sp. NA_296.1 TaxID=3415648 RepID=UPI004045C82E
MNLWFTDSILIKRRGLITMQDARENLKAWQHDHNHHRPHGWLGYLTPSEFVKKRLDQQLESRSTPVLKRPGMWKIPARNLIVENPTP